MSIAAIIGAFLALVFIAACAGMVRPFPKSAKRWHFGAAAAGSIFLAGIIPTAEDGAQIATTTTGSAVADATSLSAPVAYHPFTGEPGIDPEEAALIDKNSDWIMENVAAGDVYDPAALEDRLGAPQVGPSLQPGHQSYFYPSAYMTLIVDASRKRIATWKVGNTIPPFNATRTDFQTRGTQWPLTIEEGWVGCENGAVWFMAPTGKVYAVNGLAESVYEDITPIWAEDVSRSEIREPRKRGAPIARLNIGGLTAEGLKSCTDQAWTQRSEP